MVDVGSHAHVHDIITGISGDNNGIFMCGWKGLFNCVKEIKSNEMGTIDLTDLAQNMTEDVAALMVTNPNTLGIFEADVEKVLCRFR